MIKHPIILLVLFGYTSFCHAQIFDDPSTTRRTRTPGRGNVEPRTIKLASITFKGNHDFYFTVDDTPYRKVLKSSSREVKLDVGVHKLSFEEADSTGENIEVFFRVTNDMVNRDSLYTVNFKNDFVDIIQSHPLDSSKLDHGRMLASEQAPKIRNVATELLADMAPIQGGSFNMGSEGQADEKPHEVKISMVKFGKHEVTQQQWQTVMGYNNSSHKGNLAYPVENVSWEEVNDFISKLNKNSSQKFRLPTEAEWEFVANEIFKKEVGTATHEDVLKRKRKAFFERTTWYYGNSKNGSQPVGQKSPSLEVYDLFGNVSEWCFDFYQPDYQNQKPNDPRGPTTGTKKVIKGGSYKDKEEDLRIELRNADFPSSRSKTVGFRLVIEAY